MKAAHLDAPPCSVGHLGERGLRGDVPRLGLGPLGRPLDPGVGQVSHREDHSAKLAGRHARSVEKDTLLGG